MGTFSNARKRPVESFLVTKGNADIANTTSADLHINNATTKAVRLLDGETGLISTSATNSTSFYEFFSSPTNVPQMQIVVGTKDSANPGAGTAQYPLSVIPYEQSGLINGSGVLVATKQLAEAPTFSTWVVGNTANPIVATDETTFGLTIVYRGRIFDEYYSCDSSTSYQPDFITPDYTTLATAVPVDHLIQNLTKEINLNSTVVGEGTYQGNELVVAFALADSGDANGTAANALAPGNFTVINYQSVGNKVITLTAEMITSIQAAVADAGLNVATKVLTIDTTSAGTTTNGSAISFIVMGLDRTLAYEDRVPQVKTRIDLGLAKGFIASTVFHNEGSKAFEGKGQPRALNQWYLNTHGQRKYNLNHLTLPVPAYPSPIDMTTTYIQYTIQHVDVSQVGIGGMVLSPQSEFILIPSADAVTIAAFEADVNAWLTANAGGKTFVTL